MTGNIIGEPTEGFVAKEVKLRQKIYGAGSDGKARTTDQAIYMNNRNAWIKVASGASVTDPGAKLPKSIPNTQLNLFKQNGLAKKALLFNGLSSLVAGVTTQRQGANLAGNGPGNSKVFNNSVYGLGGTEQGFQPMPGIETVNITNKNRGSIRTATITLTAFNKFQFEIIEALYLRLGFTLLIEWGWDKYINHETNKIENVGNTVTETSFFGTNNQDDILQSIISFRSIYNGNYDGYFGRVTNFNWSFEDDGTYKITIKLASLGDVMESFKINTTPNKKLHDKVSGLENEAVSSNGNNRLKYLKKEGSIISSEKSSTQLGALLYEKLAQNSLWKADGDKNYFNLHHAIASSDNYGGISTYKKDSSSPSIGENSLNKRYCYYVSFGELLRLIHTQILPNVNDSTFKHLEIDLDSTHTICSYTPNLISYDPRVCMIKMDDGYAFNQTGMSGILTPDYTEKMKPFIRTSIKEDLAGISEITIINKQTKSERKVRVKNLSESLVNMRIKLGILKDIDGNPIILKKSDKATKLMGVTVFGKLEEIKEIKPLDTISKGTLIWGEIHNIYLNYDIIFKLLKETVDKKGALTLFKFLVGICDEINSSFANILDIEPIIKDDKVITFMDQKPIQGGSKSLKELIAGFNHSETANIEVFGFNKTKGEGTFVKSLSFNTKISPKISNQLAIGATASGTAVGEDATGYSNWNKGMLDRFNQVIEEPGDEDTDTSNLTNTQKQDYDLIKFRGGTKVQSVIGSESVTTQKTTKISYVDSDYVFNHGNDTVTDFSKQYTIVSKNPKVEFTIDNETGAIIGDVQIKVKLFRQYGSFKENKDKTIQLTGFQNNSLQQIFNKSVNSTWFAGGGENRSATQSAQNLAQKLYKEICKALAKAYKVQEPNFEFSDNGFWSASDSLNDQTSPDVDSQRKKRAEKRAAVSDVNYTAYLASMFGGKPRITNEQAGNIGINISYIDRDEAKYTVQYNGTDFSSAGKNSYKMWLSHYTNEQYNSGEGGGGASNQSGFIPVEFDIELDGISGFKIYNKVNIDQRILPSNYSEALEFLVKGLNHKIDNMGWTTNLETLSTSNLNVRTQRYNRNYEAPDPGFPPARPPLSNKFKGTNNDLQPIKDLIAEFESRGKYSIANQGKQGGYKISSTDITQNTISDLLDNKSTTFADAKGSSAVFAMGRYQVIPTVLNGAVKKGIIERSALFNPESQEIVCDYLLLKKRRSQIGKYLNGDNAGSIRDLERAIDGLGQEWASMPVVSKTAKNKNKVGNVVAGTGKSAYYGGDGINPSTSKTDVRTAVQKMIESRIKYSKKVPDFIPSYVTV